MILQGRRLAVGPGRGSVGLTTARLVAGLTAGALLWAMPQPSAGAAPTGGAFDAVDAHVRATAAAWGVPGVAYAVAEYGEVVHLAAFGDAGDRRAMTPDTPVVIGSVGKSITALAVSQLVADGRLDLDAPVTRYLPDFTLAGPDGAAARMTVRSLVLHTSGLSTADGQDRRWYAPGLAPSDVVRGLAAVRADGATGRYAYSNLNYVLLGAIVAAVTGTSYGDYVQANVFRPLGMTRSFTSLEAASTAGPAQGHRYLFGVPVPFDEPYPSAMVAAGYQVSTARDMASYVAALANGGVLGGADIVTGRTPVTASRALGTDWLPAAAPGPGVVIGQSGSTLSSNADILVQPDRGLGVVVILNANPTQLFGLPAGAAELALDVARLSTGGSASSSAPPVRAAYAAVDAVLAVLVLLFAVHLARARSWRRRYAAAEHRHRLAGRAIAADLVLPVAVLVGVPLWIGSTGSSAAGDIRSGWAFALWTLPDLSATVLALALGSLALGAWKLVAARSLRGAGPAHPERATPA